MAQASSNTGFADPVSPVPRFRQIVDHLRREIIGRRLPEHAALPSERAVAEIHNVSRMTARRALEAIEVEGLAYSEKRRGRFVSPRRLDYNVNSMANFMTDAAADGIELEVEIIERMQSPADKRLTEMLSIPAGEMPVATTRRFLDKGHAIFLETEYITAAERDRLLGPQETASPEPPDQRISPLGHSADIVVRMCAVQPGEAALLGLAPHQAGIEQEQVIRDENGTAFCFSRQIWRGELAQFSAQAIVNR